MSFKIWSRTRKYRRLDEIEPQNLRDLYAYWSSKRVGKDVPHHKDINPWEIAEVIDHVALIDIDTVARRARYLAVGDNLKRLLGKDPTNLTIDEAYPASIAREVYQTIGVCLRRREPSFYHREFVILGQRFGYYRLILPLRTVNEDVSRIMIGIYPTDPELREARTWQRAALRLYRKQGPRDVVIHPVTEHVWDSYFRD